jgi:surfactin synthase thioesterase subunit
MSATSSTSWCISWTRLRSPMALVDLVCFHHAGGGSASFHSLRQALADVGADVALQVATLPGRESRRAEPRHVDADSCVHALADELEEQLTRPHVLLGHSMGALLAYSISQQRISRGLRPPEAVIVASCRAPHQPAPAENLQSMDDYRLAVRLARYGGLPTGILDRPDWLAFLMPIVRDDLRIFQSFRPSADPPLPCPLHIFGGRDDLLTPPDTLVAWQTHSLQPHPVRLYHGGHFLFRSPDPALVTAIARVAVDATRQRSGIH